MSILLLQLFNGISLSSILLLIALGLAITFGLMNVINMAHGEFLMIGAYMAYMIQLAFQKYVPASAFGYYFAVSLAVSFLAAGLIGWILEKNADPFPLRPPARQPARHLGRQSCTAAACTLDLRSA